MFVQFLASPSSIPVFGSSSKTLDFGSLSKEGSGFKPDKSSTPLTFSFNTVEKTPLLSAGNVDLFLDVINEMS